MKNIKKRLLVVLCMALCVLCACSFVACKHTHSYTEIGSNDAQHWNYCKDDNAIDETSKANHVDADGDGKCDVCDHAVAAAHEHSYTEWGSDDDDHWKKCSCGAIDESTKAAHVDANKDGKCDECAHAVPIPHEHSYTEWGSDDDYHWKKCSCGAIDESTKTAHVDVDKSGKCDVCKHTVPVQHDHEYTKVGKNETQHWNECSCGAVDESSKTNHADTDGNGKCDVCGEHVHNYNVVGGNDEQHWNACSCGAVDESSKGNHADTDGDDLCDGCRTHCHEHYFEISDLNFDPVNGQDGTVTVTCEEDGFCYYKGGKSVTVKAIPREDDFGKEVTAESAAPVYYYIAGYYDNTTYMGWTIPTEVSFELGDTTTLEYLYAYSKEYASAKEFTEYYIENTAIESGSNKALLDNESETPYFCLFRASATDGKISFTMQNVYGSYDNPISIRKNTKYNSIDYVYYTYTADATEELWLVCDKGGVSISVGDQYTNTRYTKVAVVEGMTYKICVGFDTANAFKLTQEIPGVGDTYDNALSLLSNTPYSHTNVERHYIFTASAEGRLKIDITEGFDYTVYYQDTGWSGAIVYQKYWDMPWLKAGDSVWIVVGNPNGASYTITASTKPLAAVDNTFTVTNNEGKPISGVTVTVDEASGVTGADGKVVLNFVPGNYEIKLSGYDSSLIYTAQYTRWDKEDPETDDAGNYEIVLKQMVVKKFVVQDSKGNKIEGATVVLYTTGYSELKRSAATDSNGETTIADMFDSSNYRIGIIADDYYNDKPRVKGSVLSNAAEKYTLEAKEKSVYTFTVSAPEGVSVDGATISIKDYNDSTIGTGVIANGVATVKISSVPISANMASWYSIGVSGLPTGYSYEQPDLGSTTVTLTIVEASAPTGPQLALGDNTVEVAYDNDTGWSIVTYGFTSANGGAYTLTLTDELGGAVVYIAGGYDAILCKDNWESVLTYTFTLEAGESISFEATSANDAEWEHEYTLTLSEATLATSLTEGSNYVQGTYMGNSITFTSEEGGRFKISSEDENFYILDDNFEEVASSSNPYTFELEAGGSITFGFSTYDSSASDNYIVMIERVYR